MTYFDPASIPSGADGTGGLDTPNRPAGRFSPSAKILLECVVASGACVATSFLAVGAYAVPSVPEMVAPMVTLAAIMTAGRVWNCFNKMEAVEERQIDSMAWLRAECEAEVTQWRLEAQYWMEIAEELRERAALPTYDIGPGEYREHPNFCRRQNQSAVIISPNWGNRRD